MFGKKSYLKKDQKDDKKNSNLPCMQSVYQTCRYYMYVEERYPIYVQVLSDNFLARDDLISIKTVWNSEDESCCFS